MPRPRSSVSLSGNQAQYVLNRLIADRRISAKDVHDSIASMQRDIEDLESRLQSLRGMAADMPARRGRPAAAPASAPAASAPAAAPRRRRRARVSAETKASRVLQGRYLGLIRQVPDNKRGKYKKIAAASGREAAIKAMMVARGK